MPRDLEREALVDSSQFVEKGMITFFGKERNLHCSISQERLVLYPESWLYKSWLKKNQAINGEFFTGFSERNLELIIAHMKGEHVDIDMKDNEEISILVADFQDLNVPLPLYLTERISKQKWNDGSKGIYTNITTLINDLTKQKSDLNSISNSNNEQTVILNKLLGLINQLISDNKILKDDSISLKNDMKGIKDDNNSIKNDMKGIKDDNNSLKNDMKGIKDDNNSVKNDIIMIKSKIDKINNNNCIINCDQNDIKNINKQHEYNNNINNEKENFLDSNDNKNISNIRPISPNNLHFSPPPPMNDLHINRISNNSSIHPLPICPPMNDIYINDMLDIDSVSPPPMNDLSINRISNNSLTPPPPFLPLPMDDIPINRISNNNSISPPPPPMNDLSINRISNNSLTPPPPFLPLPMDDIPINRISNNNSISPPPPMNDLHINRISNNSLTPPPPFLPLPMDDIPINRISNNNSISPPPPPMNDLHINRISNNSLTPPPPFLPLPMDDIPINRISNNNSISPPPPPMNDLSIKYMLDNNLLPRPSLDNPISFILDNDIISHPPMNDLPIKPILDNNSLSLSSPSVSPSHLKHLSPSFLENNVSNSLVKSHDNNNKVKDTSFDKSIILNDSFQYISSLTDWLGKEKKWKLLFRASEHNYSVREFHKYCDNQGETVTLIKHIGHNNLINIFGGYTDQNWNSSNREKPYSKEFIFSLSNEHRISPTKYYYTSSDTDCGIYCCTFNGPTFGCGDITICDNCHDDEQSFCLAVSFGEINTREQSSLFVNTNKPDAYNLFKVDDYEIWGRT
ncbi:hypothetical protein WA158_008146 [Blastocystis sp. Blastoise]